MFIVSSCKLFGPEIRRNGKDEQIFKKKKILSISLKLTTHHVRKKYAKLDVCQETIFDKIYQKLH